MAAHVLLPSILQVELEAFSGDMDFDRLPGLWRLLYTTAEDVVSSTTVHSAASLPLSAADLFESETTPSAFRVQRPLAGANWLPFLPLHVGDIYQRFSSPADGTVQNIIKFSVPSLFSSQPALSAAFVVDARYSVMSGRRIALTFHSANLRESSTSLCWV